MKVTNALPRATALSASRTLTIISAPWERWTVSNCWCVGNDLLFSFPNTYLCGGASPILNWSYFFCPQGSMSAADPSNWERACGRTGTWKLYARNRRRKRNWDWDRQCFPCVCMCKCFLTGVCENHTDGIIQLPLPSWKATHPAIWHVFNYHRVGMSFYSWNMVKLGYKTLALHWPWL